MELFGDELDYDIANELLKLAKHCEQLSYDKKKCSDPVKKRLISALLNSERDLMGIYERKLLIFLKKIQEGDVMGVGLYYKNVDPNEGNYFASGSRMLAILEKAFGEFPARLTADDIPKLEGISACGYRDVDNLISALKRYERGVVLSSKN